MDRRTFLAGAAVLALPRPWPRSAVKRTQQVYGVRMACVETEPPRSGTPTFVFLHGNPTSSYLWRNIIPAVAGLGRCVAPDLVGMGDSEKLEPSGDYRYRFVEHRDYLDALLEAVGIGGRVILVVHDWGGMLGFDWARRHPERVAGIAHMETVMDGLDSSAAPAAALDFFRRYRSAAGTAAVLVDNQFVEQVLIRSLGAALTEADRTEYRRPFAAAGESRRPTLMWPRELPIDGDPGDVAAIFAEARHWLSTSQVPKLFLNVTPGALIAAPGRKAICRSWPNTTEVAVPGSHFVQEESPGPVGAALARWAAALR
ncbi:MAG: haloalkane dehalogenase [Gemmatimonadales bacterium]